MISTKLVNKSGVTFLTFPSLELPGLVHGFSTRIGGVSDGCLSSMNLSFSRNDVKENVFENHKRLAKAIGYDEKRLVFSNQIHETTIRCVTSSDCGNGILFENRYTEGVDGLITNEPNVPLITFYADCVPIFFYDKVKKVVALAHSGWKGTVKKIGEKMVTVMKENYGSDEGNIITAIGPSICQQCYEVDEDVIKEFKNSFLPEECIQFIQVKETGKYLFDLWHANEILLTKSGILKEHLIVTDLCTCCNPDLFFSHRASKGNRGNLGAVIMLT